MGRVDELTSMWELFAILALLGLLALRGYHLHRRRPSSDRTLCATRLLRDGKRLVASPRLSLTLPGRLCRIALEVQLEGEYELRPRWPFRRVVREIGPPYKLTLSDGSGRVLFEEQERLDRFLSPSWSYCRDEATFWLSERSRWSLHDTIVVLELVPREVAVCQVALQVDVRTEVDSQHSSSWCELVEAKLIATEDAEPFSRFSRRAHPHRTVEV